MGGSVKVDKNQRTGKKGIPLTAVCVLGGGVSDSDR